MSRPHQALATTVIFIWASNFVVMRWGLDLLPPLALCAWRFALSFFPACLVLRPPKGRWRLTLAFGMLTGLGQFGLLCIAMRSHISPGLASIVVQTQAFFNIALAAVILGEKIKPGQIAGSIVSATGLIVIIASGDASATIFGIVLVLGAALSWALSNVILRACRYNEDFVALMVWSSLFGAIPLILCSLAFEGSAAILEPLSGPSVAIWLIILWQAFANSIFGYAVWNSLIYRYSLSIISPLTLLVPVLAMALAVIFVDEKLESWKLAAAALIVAGVATPYCFNSVAKLIRPASQPLRP
jgi:O-acetylserine/cysteine efflux transporter